MHLKTSLNKLGISQHELARRTGINRGTLNLWLNGKGPLTESNYPKVAGVFGIPIPELKERWAADLKNKNLDYQESNNPFGKMNPDSIQGDIPL